MAKLYYKPGRYWGKLTKQQVGKTSNGNPQLVMSFDILGQVNPADPEGDLLPCGQTFERTIYRVITDKTIDYVLSDLEKLGWEGSSWSQFDEHSSVFCDIRGNELAIQCDHEPHYQTGVPREVWSIAHDSNGPKVDPLTDSDFRKLDALFGRDLKKRAKTTNGKQTKREPAPQTADAPAEVTSEAATQSEDIPF